MLYRVTAGVLGHLLPINAGINPETLRGRTLKVAEDLVGTAATKPEEAVSAITLTMGSTYIRSCEAGQRHLEVRLGNVETAVAGTDTEIEKLIRRSLKEVGQVQEAEPTVFTDGCPELRSIVVDAGVTTPPPSRLVPYRHAAAPCRKDSRHPAD
jgi:hypothetical protein